MLLQKPAKDVRGEVLPLLCYIGVDTDVELLIRRRLRVLGFGDLTEQVGEPKEISGILTDLQERELERTELNKHIEVSSPGLPTCDYQRADFHWTVRDKKKGCDADSRAKDYALLEVVETLCWGAKRSVGTNTDGFWMTMLRHVV